MRKRAAVGVDTTGDGFTDTIVAKRQGETELKDGKRKARKARVWTPEENDLLRTAVAQYGEKNWKSIAEHVPGRNHTQCLQRWKKALKPGIRKGHWSAEEDNLLRHLVAQGTSAGFKNWGDVAKGVSGRTSKQCRQRWCDHLDPSINRSPFTIEEDNRIRELQAQHGNKWALISRELKGRPEEAIKIRWRTLSRLDKLGSTDQNRNVSAPAQSTKPKSVAAMGFSIPKFVGRSSTACPETAQAAVSQSDMSVGGDLFAFDALLGIADADLGMGTIVPGIGGGGASSSRSQLPPTTHSHNSTLSLERKHELVRGALELLQQLSVTGSIVQAPSGVAVDTNNDGQFDKWAMPVTDTKDVVGVDTTGDGRVDSFAVPIDTLGDGHADHVAIASVTGAGPVILRRTSHGGGSGGVSGGGEDMTRSFWERKFKERNTHTQEHASHKAHDAHGRAHDAQVHPRDLTPQSNLPTLKVSPGSRSDGAAAGGVQSASGVGVGMGVGVGAVVDGASQSRQSMVQLLGLTDSLGALSQGSQATIGSAGSGHSMGTISGSGDSLTGFLTGAASSSNSAGGTRRGSGSKPKSHMTEELNHSLHSMGSLEKLMNQVVSPRPAVPRAAPMPLVHNHLLMNPGVNQRRLKPRKVKSFRIEDRDLEDLHTITDLDLEELQL